MGEYSAQRDFGGLALSTAFDCRQGSLTPSQYDYLHALNGSPKSQMSAPHAGWKHLREIWASDGNSRFGRKGFKHGRFPLKDLWPKGFDMESDCRLDITQRVFVGVSLANNNPFQAKWIGNVPSRYFSTMIFSCLVTVVSSLWNRPSTG